MAETQLPFDVAWSQLGPLEEINKGANGRIHRLKDRPAVVFKEFNTAVPAAPLRQLIQIRRQAKRGEDIKGMTAWPTRVVFDDRPGAPGAANQAIGVLMPLIPPGFMQKIDLPDGSATVKPRDIQHLLFAADVARRRGVDVPADHDVRSRMLICERLSFIVAALHYENLVYGDLSVRNILYQTDPRPDVYLVDCDAARPNGATGGVRQQNTPDWDPPEHDDDSGGLRHQSLETDRYKLGLFILRCLAPGRGGASNRDVDASVGMLDPEGAGLLRSALEGGPADRPTAGTWTRYWRQHLRLGPLPPAR